MASNEHPDMSGNPCDKPLLCDYCECHFREEDSWESPLLPGQLFCCYECLEDAEDENDEKEFSKAKGEQ